jgi:hypothetical protein
MVGPRTGRSRHSDETSPATCRQPGDEGPWSLAGESARWCRRGWRIGGHERVLGWLGEDLCEMAPAESWV